MSRADYEQSNARLIKNFQIFHIFVLRGSIQFLINHKNKCNHKNCVEDETLQLVWSDTRRKEKRLEEKSCLDYCSYQL